MIGRRSSRRRRIETFGKMSSEPVSNSGVPSGTERKVNITVQQSKFSLRSEYEISTPGCIYFAQKKFFSWRDKISLTDPRDQVLARVIGRLSLFRLRHDIELADGRIYHFWREKFGNGDQYEILMNEDANLLVVVCLALIVDASENEGDTSSVTYDFGNIGPEARPFDKSWEPS